MRGKGKADIANILPSVRARGVLVPLIVRANGTSDTYEIVAGTRRYHAALAVADETGERDPLPCAVIEAGDDAAAFEASLIENIARLDPDEVTRWESFTRLVREGRKPDQIAATFGLTELKVKRTLPLGNLLPRIRGLYRRGEIDAATVRHLTLISKAQQQQWLALLDDPEAHFPTGHQLKSWLLCRARHNAHYADRAIMPRLSCQSAFVRGLWFTPVGIIASSRGQVLPARASMARSLSEGGLNRPGFTPGGAWAARIASFSTGSARK